MLYETVPDVVSDVHSGPELICIVKSDCFAFGRWTLEEGPNPAVGPEGAGWGSAIVDLLLQAMVVQARLFLVKCTCYSSFVLKKRHVQDQFFLEECCLACRWSRPLSAE